MVLVSGPEEGHKHHKCGDALVCPISTKLVPPSRICALTEQKAVKGNHILKNIGNGNPHFSLRVALLSLESVPSHQRETSFWIESQSEVRTPGLHAFWVSDSSI